MNYDIVVIFIVVCFVGDLLLLYLFNDFSISSNRG